MQCPYQSNALPTQAGAFCRTAIVNLLKTLNTHLESRTYLVTERITHADIVVASVLKTVFAKHVDKAGREAAPNVVRFYDTVGNQPKLKEFLGEPKWLEKFVRPTGK